SKASAFFGTMLQIKPVLDVDDAGRLIPHFKVKGRKKSILEMFNRMKEDIKDPDGQTVFISHGDCPEDAEALKAMILEHFNIDNVLINYVGPVIGAHSGPGTLALFYMGKQRYN
ncbi:MAG: DegV family EDD domain-containing protein, partial [Clostridiales bacterium]|nr:DegV family EDD domain-containing protein [Clostridiales bacterium]